ncbi:hypothetical protein ACROYT_G012244 [Oculina patagonica]
MFRPSVRRRWQTTASKAVQNDREAGNSGKDKKHDSKKHDSKQRAHSSPASVQWAIDLHRSVRLNTSQRKHYSEGRIEFDKVLRKLTEISSILERSALLERDYESDLRTIQVKLQAGY